MYKSTEWALFVSSTETVAVLRVYTVQSIDGTVFLSTTLVAAATTADILHFIHVCYQNAVDMKISHGHTRQCRHIMTIPFDTRLFTGAPTYKLRISLSHAHVYLCLPSLVPCLIWLPVAFWCCTQNAKCRYATINGKLSK